MDELWRDEVLLWATAAVHAVLSAFVLIYHRHLRTEPWERAFGLFIFSMSLASAGCALVTGATDPAVVVWGQRLAWVGLVGAAMTFLDFQQATDADAAPWLRPASRTLHAGVQVAVFAGLLVQEGVAPGAPRWLLFDAPVHRIAAPSTLGLAVIWLAPPLLGASLLRLVQVGRVATLGRFGIAAFAVTQLSAIHDLAIWAGHLRSHFLTPTVALTCSFAMSFVILRRSVSDRETLRRRRGELQRSYAELRRARDELVSTEQLAALGGLSAVIAHEVRNPLTVIKQAASGLRRRGEAARQHELVRVVDEEANRLASLVNDLLVYAKPLRLERVDYHLGERVEGLALEVLDEEARDDGVGIEVRGEGPTLSADARLLEQALRNVVRNAVQASPAGGVVYVEVGAARLHGEPAVRVSVRDQGPGMDDETRAHALDPFFTTRAKGSGLGLPIVDRIVGAHAGELSLRPAAGGGLEVVCVLPQVPPEA